MDWREAPVEVRTSGLLSIAFWTSVCLNMSLWVPGVIGVALSAALAMAVTSTGKFEMAIGLKAVVIATVFSCVVGVFFGFYPARRASKLQPVECLRHE